MREVKQLFEELKGLRSRYDHRMLENVLNMESGNLRWERRRERVKRTLTPRQLEASLTSLMRKRERQRDAATAQIEGIKKRLREVENGITRPEPETVAGAF